MASGPHTFITVTVFSPERGAGSSVALVSVRANALSQKQKVVIAREFRYSEIAFLHDAQSPGMPRKMEVYNGRGEELPLAGHTALAAAHYIFNWVERSRLPNLPPDPQERDSENRTAVLLTKSGPISIFFNSSRIVGACSIPHNFHIHSKSITLDKILEVQPQLQIVPTIDKYKDKSFPVVSLIKGVSFALVDLDEAPEAFNALRSSNAPEVELDSQWLPSQVGCYFYRRGQRSEQAGEPTIQNLQARMITQGYEDAGNGSAACALACYLSLLDSNTTGKGTEASSNNSTTGSGPTEQSGATSSTLATASEDELVQKTANVKLEDRLERKVFGIQQGAEMGRLCTIAVEVDVKIDTLGNRSISSIILSGRANYFTRGELLGW